MRIGEPAHSFNPDIVRNMLGNDDRLAGCNADCFIGNADKISAIQHADSHTEAVIASQHTMWVVQARAVADQIIIYDAACSQFVHEQSPSNRFSESALAVSGQPEDQRLAMTMSTASSKPMFLMP